MLSWNEFSAQEPELADAAMRLLAANEVAFLATTSRSGRPRLHPFVPKVVNGRLVAFIKDNSPKIHDLAERQFYAIHMLPGEEDEQMMLNGRALCCNAEQKLREQTEIAMSFATGVDVHHILYEFKLDRVLWTRWLDFGTPDHRPVHRHWKPS